MNEDTPPAAMAAATRTHPASAQEFTRSPATASVCSQYATSWRIGPGRAASSSRAGGRAG